MCEVLVVICRPQSEECEGWVNRKESIFPLVVQCACRCVRPQGRWVNQPESSPPQSTFFFKVLQALQKVKVKVLQALQHCYQYITSFARKCIYSCCCERLSKESKPCSSCTSLTPNFASAVLEEFQSLRIIFEGEVQSWIYFAHSSITVSNRACFESNQSSIDWSVLGRKERKSLLVRAFDVYCTVNVIARFKIIRCVKGCFYWNRFVFILTKSNLWDFTQLNFTQKVLP